MAPLLQSIADAVIEGELPRDFSLPQPDDGNAIRFADGAQDGICIYHAHLSEVDGGLLARAVHAASARNYDEADALFSSLAEPVRAISVIDPLQSYVIEHKDELDAASLHAYALALMRLSESTECVKVGLSLLELFDISGDEAAKRDVRTLGLSDEFTLFSLFIVRHWEDSNEEIFDLARKVRGWGRVHAVEFLEPATDEIRRWLLHNGVDNDVLPAYSALTCWTKAGALKVLLGQPSYDDFAAVREIVSGLLDEGPVKGISALINKDYAMERFVEVARKMPLEERDYEVIEELRSYYTETVSERNRIAMACRKLLEGR